LDHYITGGGRTVMFQCMVVGQPKGLARRAASAPCATLITLISIATTRAAQPE
jgi:hypothetical protein